MADGQYGNKEDLYLKLGEILFNKANPNLISHISHDRYTSCLERILSEEGAQSDFGRFFSLTLSKYDDMALEIVETGHIPYLVQKGQRQGPYCTDVPAGQKDFHHDVTSIVRSVIAHKDPIFNPQLTQNLPSLLACDEEIYTAFEALFKKHAPKAKEIAHAILGIERSEETPRSLMLPGPRTTLLAGPNP